METALREDYLEALFKYAQERNSPPAPSEFADYLGKPVDEVRKMLAALEKEGDIEPGGDHIRLSTQGRDLGRRVLRKHQTLERFFTEVLGFDPDIASTEACTLEHKVSDDAIARLGTYIRNPFKGGDIPCRRRGRGGWRFSSILDFSEGAELVIKNIPCHGNYSRLADLGIFPGEKIVLVRKLSNDAVVIRVKGCDIALSPEIAQSVCVEHPG